MRRHPRRRSGNQWTVWLASPDGLALPWLLKLACTLAVLICLKESNLFPSWNTHEKTTKPVSLNSVMERHQNSPEPLARNPRGTRGHGTRHAPGLTRPPRTTPTAGEASMQSSGVGCRGPRKARGPAGWTSGPPLFIHLEWPVRRGWFHRSSRGATGKCVGQDSFS